MKKFIYNATIYISILLLIGCAAAQQGAVSIAYTKIGKGQYIQALDRLSNAEKYAALSPELEAEILYLKAVCYEGLSRNDDAKGALKYLIAKYSDTSYGYQAKEKLLSLGKSTLVSDKTEPKLEPKNKRKQAFKRT